MQDSSRVLKSFGLAVRRRRTILEIPQDALAEKAGLHRTYIGSVERGERNISLQNIFAISKALGVRPSKLLANTEAYLTTES